MAQEQRGVVTPSRNFLELTFTSRSRKGAHTYLMIMPKDGIKDMKYLYCDGMM
jgi:hypothetical protein